MAIAFDQASTPGQGVGGTSLTWSGGTIAADGCLVVGAHAMGDSTTVSGVTHNGDTMTELVETDLSGGVAARAAAFIRVAPDASGNIVATLSGTSAGYIVGTSASYTGVEQASDAAAHRTVYTAGNGGGGTPTVTVVDSQSGDLCVGVLSNYGTAPVAADTARQTVGNTGGSAYDAALEDAAASGASTVVNYTGGEWWTLIAFALVPSGAAPSGHPTVKRTGGVAFVHRLSGAQNGRVW